MEAHGGYLCRLEGFGSEDVIRIAREGGVEDGLDPAQASLQVSGFTKNRLVRIAYDTPKVYGRKGAQWYATHHALARRLSEATGETVHCYLYDPEELEQVTAYGNGRRVGGQTLRYEDAEPLGEGEITEAQFERFQDRWPLGHLAYMFGLGRKELLRLPWAPSLLLPLAEVSGGRSLQELWQETCASAVRARHPAP